MLFVSFDYSFVPLSLLSLNKHCLYCISAYTNAQDSPVETWIFDIGGSTRSPPVGGTETG